MRWPWKRRTSIRAYEPVSQTLAGHFYPGGVVDLGGIAVNENSAMTLSAFWRAMSLISGQLASLPFTTHIEKPGVLRKPVPSVFDMPDGEFGQTSFEWKESLFLHLLMHGKAGALKVRTEAGALSRLPLVHPLSFTVRQPTKKDIQDGRAPVGGLWFDVRLNDGTSVILDGADFWYVPGLSLDGVNTLSVLQYARASMATSMAGDKAAGKMFTTGALISGIATPEDDDVDISEELGEIKRVLEASTGGYENAGGIALVSRRLKIQPWAMNASDAQFLESRQFQIEEVSRWTGVPPHLLMQTEKQTSWGTGVEMQDRALGRSVLGTWARRVEERANRVLPKPRFVSFDFAALERPSPDREIELDLKQVQQGVMTIDEYRAKRGWEPLEAEEQPVDDPAPGQDLEPQEVADDPVPAE
jgi:HK97 family phage portal protein